MATKVLTLVGSLRSGSTNQQLAEATVVNAPEGVEVELFAGLENIPFYNEDKDVAGSVPAAAQALRDAATAADALMLVTPEYNGTMPAVLKNAIDWLSRPFGAGAVKDMPSVVVGTAFGQYGGVWAQDEARKALGIAGAKVLEEVKMAIPNSVVRFAELNPKDDAEVGEQVAGVLNSIKAVAEAN
ncbi:FMN reductase [Glutamicibacter soli]|uniref:FMN reductase n=1 Tax=Glutamicibacter soli TaxID=453836 RepID=A0A6L9G946_9MICC|nr:NAD(P)H-dependent oxidoreductase [Glutamicibacter soli]NAZ17717.1 FMN reductase [Glutamicibacter soli]